VVGATGTLLSGVVAVDGGAVMVGAGDGVVVGVGCAAADVR
jgi:hypothetical protein